MRDLDNFELKDRLGMHPGVFNPFSEDISVAIPASCWPSCCRRRSCGCLLQDLLTGSLGNNVSLPAAFLAHDTMRPCEMRAALLRAANVVALAASSDQVVRPTAVPHTSNALAAKAIAPLRYRALSPCGIRAIVPIKAYPGPARRRWRRSARVALACRAYSGRMGSQRAVPSAAERAAASSASHVLVEESSAVP